MAVPFMMYLAAGYLFQLEHIDVSAERTLSANRFSSDEAISVDVTIKNKGSSIPNLVFEDIIPVGLRLIDGSPKKITSIASGETVSFSYRLQGKRGIYHLSRFRISASDHLGLIQKTKILDQSDRIMIVPEAIELPRIAIQPRRTRVFPGLIPARKGGAGVEFFGVREYHPSDPQRWINHRVSARHDDTLFVNEFEQERAVDVGIILDCRVDTNLIRGSQELLEYGTQAAATLADAFLNYGNRVGMLIYGGGRNWVHPGYGKLQRERILRALAGVRLFENVVSKELSNLPTRLFPAYSQLVLISSLMFEDLPTLIALRAHGYRLLIISPDPIEFETRLLKHNRSVSLAVRIARLERQVLLQQIKRTGARVFEWKVDQPFHELAHFALTPTINLHRSQVVTYA
jgi:uncharacterized protein (DUF58 family)